jgi:coxsackievirus/adenovirus receptor
LRGQTEQVVVAAGQIRETGATGAYTREFETMENKLSDVRALLLNTTLSGHELSQLEELFSTIKTNLTMAGQGMDGLDATVENTTQRVFSVVLALSNLRSKATDLQTAAQSLKNNATKLQEANVEGALNLTREARQRSQKAQDRVEFTQQPVSDSERQRRRTEALLSRVAPQLGESQQRNAADLADLGGRLAVIERSLPELNDAVCDGRGDPCDSLCGGGGCGKCGALSCEEGSVTKAENALSLAKEAEGILRNRQSESEEMMRGVRQAEVEAEAARVMAREALLAAELAQNRSEAAKAEVDELMNQIDEYLEQSGASPADIRSLATDVLSKGISLQPEQITDLARRINETISSLTNIDAILAETSGDLASAKALKDRADAAKAHAQGILTVAQQVLDSLAAAKAAQDKAEEAIQTADKVIELQELFETKFLNSSLV